MNFNKIIEKLELLTHDGVIKTNVFNNYFKIVNSSGDGNCLFHSVAYFFNGYTHTELRKLVCEFYKNFKKNLNYNQDSLEYMIQQNLIYDRYDDGNEVHETNICNERVYGSITDISVLAIILKINIILMNYNAEKRGYSFITLKYADKNDTIFLKFNGANHFDSLVVNFDNLNNVGQQVSVINPGNLRDSKNNNNRTNHLHIAKDASKEDLEAIAKLENNNNQYTVPEIIDYLEVFENNNTNLVKNINNTTTELLELLREIEVSENKKNKPTKILKTVDSVTGKLKNLLIDIIELKSERTNDIIKKVETLKQLLILTKRLREMQKEEILNSARPVSPDIANAISNMSIKGNYRGGDISLRILQKIKNIRKRQSKKINHQLDKAKSIFSTTKKNIKRQMRRTLKKI